MTAPKALIVGLDLGTNNTYLSVIEEGNKNPTFIKSVTGADLHGTYIYYPENKDEKPIFGVPALEMLPNSNVIRLPKKALGAHAKRFTNYGVFNAEVANPGKQAPIKFKIKINGKIVQKTGKDVIVDLLKHYKEVADGYLDGREIQWVVSKPMYWNSTQAKVYQEALAEAGIHPLAVLPEPTAAMFCYRWFCSVIDANTGIPTTGMKDEFTTVKDDQEAVVVEVYQGIGKRTTDDGVTFLGRYEVPVEVPNKAGVPNIEVEMEVFADSTIVVRAGEKGKEKKELTVKDVNL